MAKKSLRSELDAAIKGVRDVLECTDDAHEEGGRAYIRDVLRPLTDIRDRLPKAGTAAAITLAALLSSGCATLKEAADILAGPCNAITHDGGHIVRDGVGRPVAEAWRGKDGSTCVQTF